MKTNLDKWNEYQAILKARDDAFIRSVIGPEIPKVFYTMQWRLNTPELFIVGVNVVEGAVYWHHTGVIWLNGQGKKPTKIAVENLRAYVGGPIAYDESNIGLHYRCSPISGAVKWPDYVAENGVFHDREKCLAVVESKRKQETEERAQLAAGTHIKCTYCGKVRKIEDIKYGTVISRMYRGYTSEPRPYCKDTPCNHHDQCAHEG